VERKAEARGVRSRPRGSAAGFWWLLLPIPVVLAIVILVPQFGTYGEGILPELVGTHLLDTEDFMAFAFDVRVWGGPILGLSCLAGIVLWFVHLRGWTARLADLRAERAGRYRAFVLRHMLIATCVAIVLSAGIALLSSSLRGIPVAGWFYLLGIAAVLAMMEYYAALLGITSTRRLFLGR